MLSNVASSIDPSPPLDLWSPPPPSPSFYSNIFHILTRTVRTHARTQIVSLLVLAKWTAFECVSSCVKVWAIPDTNSSTLELPDGNGNVELRLCLSLSNIMWCPCCAGGCRGGRCEGLQAASTFWHFSFTSSLSLPLWMGEVRSLSLYPVPPVRLMIRRGHGKARLWPCTTGVLTSCFPPHPPPTSCSPFQDSDKSCMKDLPFCRWWELWDKVGGGGGLLGLLQGTGSEFPDSSNTTVPRGWRLQVVCVCVCVCVCVHVWWLSSLVVLFLHDIITPGSSFHQTKLCFPKKRTISPTPSENLGGTTTPTIW